MFFKLQQFVIQCKNKNKHIKFWSYSNEMCHWTDSTKHSINFIFILERKSSFFFLREFSLEQAKIRYHMASLIFLYQIHRHTTYIRKCDLAQEVSLKPDGIHIHFKGHCSYDAMILATGNGSNCGRLIGCLKKKSKIARAIFCQFGLK